MKKLIFIYIAIYSSLTHCQNMSKSETLSYINNKLLNKHMTVDAQGIIKIDKTTKNLIGGIGIFYYKDVEVDYYPFHPFQVQFICKNSNECIEKLDYNPNYETSRKKYTNMISLSFEDKEEYLRVLNASGHLFEILNNENLQKSNNDPFSPENYKK